MNLFPLLSHPPLRTNRNPCYLPTGCATCLLQFWLVSLFRIGGRFNKRGVWVRVVGRKMGVSEATHTHMLVQLKCNYGEGGGLLRGLYCGRGVFPALRMGGV